MNAPRDIANAKDPDLRASLEALRRASQLARETAIQTNTSIVIVQDGKMVYVTADELHEAAKSEEPKED